MIFWFPPPLTEHTLILISRLCFVLMVWVRSWWFSSVLFSFCHLLGVFCFNNSSRGLSLNLTTWAWRSDPLPPHAQSCSSISVLMCRGCCITTACHTDTQTLFDTVLPGWVIWRREKIIFNLNVVTWTDDWMETFVSCSLGTLQAEFRPHSGWGEEAVHVPEAQRQGGAGPLSLQRPRRSPAHRQRRNLGL